MDEEQRKDADNAIFDLLGRAQSGHTGDRRDAGERHAATTPAANSVQRQPNVTLPRREALARFPQSQPQRDEVLPPNALADEASPPVMAGGGARLLAIGVGGGGSNAVNRMVEAKTAGVQFLIVNTDAQALGQSQAPHKLLIGPHLTRGMGSGGDPGVGRQAAEESYAAIVEAVTGADMVFLTAGMGGGAGTGASPLIAQAAREAGALTVAIVTTPFAFERRRKLIAEQGLAALREIVDALIVVPNERLMQLVAQDTSVFAAYRMADDVVRLGIEGISDLITIPGLINLDFADIRAVMGDVGSAYMSMGRASGEDRAEAVVRAALDNPLLNVDISGARGLIFNISGGDDLTLREVGRIAELLGAAVAPDANLIFGTVYDAQAAGALKLTLVATGFEPHVLRHPQAWNAPRVAPSSSPLWVHGAQAGEAYHAASGAPAHLSPSVQPIRAAQQAAPAGRVVGMRERAANRTVQPSQLPRFGQAGQSSGQNTALRVAQAHPPYGLDDMDDEPPEYSARTSPSQPAPHDTGRRLQPTEAPRMLRQETQSQQSLLPLTSRTFSDEYAETDEDDEDVGISPQATTRRTPSASRSLWNRFLPRH